MKLNESYLNCNRQGNNTVSLVITTEEIPGGDTHAYEKVEDALRHAQGCKSRTSGLTLVSLRV